MSTRSLAEKPKKCTKSAENCAHSYTVFEPKTRQEWLFGCVSRSLGHDWYVNPFPSVRPKAILQVSHPQIGVAN